MTFNTNTALSDTCRCGSSSLGPLGNSVAWSTRNSKSTVIRAFLRDTSRTMSPALSVSAAAVGPSVSGSALLSTVTTSSKSPRRPWGVVFVYVPDQRHGRDGVTTRECGSVDMAAARHAHMSSKQCRTSSRFWPSSLAQLYDLLHIGDPSKTTKGVKATWRQRASSRTQ